MATIKDIARMTGVSVATVSNVLNGKSGAASPEKAKQIFDAAARLKYQPNVLAKNLKLRRSHTVGIITEDLTVFNTPEIVDGIESYCEEHGFEIVLANMRLFKRYDNNLTDTPEHMALFEKTLRNLAAKQVEGVVYIGYHYRRVSYLPPQGSIPFVYAYCTPSEQRYPSVVFDNEGASFQVGTALVR
ncbi:MAG: LacI family DNA-binding transcriptional regulator, partial [Hydrogeniiclostridium sp.]